MSYSAYSIPEVMERINNINNGWYLPQVQRQYVWGTRYESETYICLLLDSLFRGYPIGGLVLWETNKEIPFREFLRDYLPGLFAKQVDHGRWGCFKSLVYDGQQRLQTLYSVLYYTFNNRILCFDLLFDKDHEESDETEFFFVDQGKIISQSSIKMNELCSKPSNPREKEALKSFYTQGRDYTDDQILLVKTNIDELWKVFVERNVKSIAFFPIQQSNDEKTVNEVFRRLNTGGIALTQIELVLTKIKAKYSDYEEELYRISTDIKSASGGFEFTPTEVLQLFYLLIYGTIKVEEGRVSSRDIDHFKDRLQDSESALREFFENYLWGLLKINSGAIVARRQTMLPIVVYLAYRSRNRHVYAIKRLSAGNIQLIHQYLILSQINDWNTQTMVNAFAQKAKEAGEQGTDFPLDSIKSIAVQKNRADVLYYHQFVSQPWFALKILTPSRVYIFFDAKPQVDHIFPLGLSGRDENYRNRVDILWNFQPMPAGVNNFKRARHPQEFFTSSEGSRYLSDYDFLPSSLTSKAWSNEKLFIWRRHLKMRKELAKRYGLKLVRLQSKSR